MSEVKSSCAYFYYHQGNRQCCETLEEHVEMGIRVWRTCIYGYYKMSLRRILRSQKSSDVFKLVGDPVEFLIIMHDVGKMVDYYQNRPIIKNPAGVYYRHEVVSAAVALEILENIEGNSGGQGVLGLFKYEGPLAILLHHEPIILGSLAGRFGEQYVTSSILRVMLDKFIGTQGTRLIGVDNFLPLVKRYVNNVDAYRAIENVLQDELKPDKLFNNLKKLFKHAITGGTLERQAKRARVAGLLHLLVLSDSIAAQIGRSNCKSGDQSSSGTWVTRRVLDPNEPAEFFPHANQKCALLIKFNDSKHQGTRGQVQ